MTFTTFCAPQYFGCPPNVFVKSTPLLLVNKISLICYFFDLIVKNLRFTRSQNAPNFGMKCSTALRFLGLRPRSRWGSLRGYPDPLVARSFLPTAIAASRLQRPQFGVLARSDRHPQLLDLNFSPPG